MELGACQAVLDLVNIMIFSVNIMILTHRRAESAVPSLIADGSILTINK